MRRRLFLQSTFATTGLLTLGGCGGATDTSDITDTPPTTDSPAADTTSVAALVTTSVAAALPTWRLDMTVGQWKQVPGSALSSSAIGVKTYPGLGSTGPTSKVVAWCGFAIDTRDSSIYTAAGGGHGDYAGNEVHRIRLSDNAPVWVERRSATPSTQVRTNVTHYADGRPTSRHSYYGAVCNQVRGRVMLMAGSRWGDGYQIRSMDGFNLATNDWDAAGTFPNVPAAVSMYYGAAIVENKSTGDIYALANYSVFKWTNATNRWSTAVASASTWGFEAASALDTKRNRILVLGGLGNDRSIYTLGTNATQLISLTGPNAGALSGAGNGMVYDPVLDAYLVRKPGSGGTVYRVNAQTFAVSTLTTTGGGTLPASQNGVYRRFLYAPNLGGVVYCPGYSTNLWFLRTA